MLDNFVHTKNIQSATLRKASSVKSVELQRLQIFKSNPKQKKRSAKQGREKNGIEVAGDLPAAHIDRRNLFENSAGENSRRLGFVAGEFFFEKYF